MLHVSILKKCIGDLVSIHPLKGIGVGEDLAYEAVPVVIFIDK